MQQDEKIKDLIRKIVVKHDYEYTIEDITSLIMTLLEVGAKKEVILKCDNIAELKAVGIYQNILRK